ncbi:MAG: aminotransferase class I/II-fold pyridoxal phosphate-dependent enzyme [Pyrinomonadaceae bacterium]|nr:aminotransferase class I/II-fold pyridoxal phosphate-dependent enzyme [Pyrinomonadaceae bacterium]
MDKTSAIGDMPDKEFREYGYRIVDKIADYFKEMENLPVLSQNEPNDLKSKLPPSAPDQGEEFAEVLKDMDDLIIPALSHWNHPNFHGLFSTSTSSVGVFGEMFIAAFDQKAMLWRTSPASTELEEVTLNWLRELMGLPEQFSGLIYDTASVSTMHAIAAARERKGLRIREDGMSGRDDLPLLRVYGSDQTHSSIEKSLITLGLGQRSMCAVKTNDRYSIDVDELRASIERDISNGFEPLCVVATIGTTSTASSDDLQAIAEICEANDIWLHVDMAYAGSAMILPELQHFMDGIESADSVVTNPHKWLFTPFDLSVLYMKDMEILRKAFSLVPEYLKVAEDVTNQMDYGIQLGRRFRSLKLWFVIRYFGADGLRSRIREHIRLAKLFASWVEESERFQLSADVDFALVCFRAVPERVEDLNSFNETLMNEINREGGAYLSHTKLDDQIVLRLSVGSIRAEERHLIKTWKLLNAKLEELCDK